MTKSEPLKPGRTFGEWTLRRILGDGGNGIVWEVTSNAAGTGAMKFLKDRHWSNQKRCDRFRDEVLAQRSCQDIPGVLAILDFHLPEKPSSTHPLWFVSCLAQTVEDELGNEPELRRVLEACRAFSFTLAEMHARDVSHRDVKPDNLFWDGSRWAVGDFGLADFRNKAARTSKGERVGPMHYHAPEMLEASEADGKAADVWSLAKTLWVLATGQRYPLPGQHFAIVPALTISDWLSDERAWRLDSVLEAATKIIPSERISMMELHRELDAWLEPQHEDRDSLSLDHVADDIHTLNASYAKDWARQSERLSIFNECVRRIRHYAGESLSLIREELEQAGLSHCFVHESALDTLQGQPGEIWQFGGLEAGATCGTLSGSKVSLSISIHVKFFEDGRTVAETIHAVATPRRRGRDREILYSHERKFQCNCPSEEAAFAEVVAASKRQFAESVRNFLDVAQRI